MTYLVHFWAAFADAQCQELATWMQLVVNAPHDNTLALSFEDWLAERTTRDIGTVHRWIASIRFPNELCGGGDKLP